MYHRGVPCTVRGAHLSGGRGWVSGIGTVVTETVIEKYCKLRVRYKAEIQFNLRLKIPERAYKPLQILAWRILATEIEPRFHSR